MLPVGLGNAGKQRRAGARVARPRGLVVGAGESYSPPEDRHRRGGEGCGAGVGKVVGCAVVLGCVVGCVGGVTVTGDGLPTKGLVCAPLRSRTKLTIGVTPNRPEASLGVIVRPTPGVVPGRTRCCVAARDRRQAGAPSPACPAEPP